jgi:alpha-L-rhamnosidase
MLPVLLMTTLAAPGGLIPVQLRCEAMTDPIGIATTTPRLSWKLAPASKGMRNLSQSGYRILVGKAPDQSDLWDSGKVDSNETFDVKYAGKPLDSGQLCWWKVQVWDQDGKASDWSAPAKWSVGLVSKEDLKAEWIGYDAPSQIARPNDPFEGASWIWAEKGTPVWLRRTFTIKPGFSKATFWITVDDKFSLQVNGSEAGKSDGQTDAWRRPSKLDLTKLLKGGENAMTVQGINAAGESGIVVKLIIEYPNGDKSELVSDEFWEASTAQAGPFGRPRVITAYGGAPWQRVGAKALVLPAPRLLRKEFDVQKEVRRATLYGSALGLLDLSLNGKAVGDELFTPGWTDYAKRVHLHAWDVGKQLSQGRNAIGVSLGDGWYSGYVGFGNNRDHYGRNIRALVQLDIEYADGTRETIATDPTWKAATGPTLEADFLMGESYDARKEIPGWNQAGFDDSGWARVDTGSEVTPAVQPFPSQPVRPYETLKAKSITEPKKGAYVLNFDQNLAGFAKLRVRGKAGQKITLRFAERLNPDGTIYTTNLRAARAIDTYICKGSGVEIWSPRFTFHGFQYIEVTGLDSKPGPNDIMAVAISSDTPETGTLTTSDAMLNKLVSNAWWTQKMNFVDVPTDCPQRDERLGWTGDAQAYVRTAAMLSDVQPFFDKWLVSLDDAQREDGQYPMVAPLKVAGGDGGPAWADAGVICPWVVYDVYGDKALLTRHYPQMKKFVEFCVNRSTPDLLPPKEFHCFGDWLNINDATPHEVIYTAYFAGSARILSQSARELQNLDEQNRYDDLYRRVRAAFQKAYVKPDGTVQGNSQCAYVLALAFDLLEPEQAKLAADKLVQNIEKRGGHLSTGFVGTRDIMHVLSKIGRNDVAFRLLHNKTFPSWGFTIVNGATSIWERWDGWTPEKGFQDPGMNSFAHYAFGAVVGWMFDQPAGIQNLAPGFRAVRIAPQIDPNLTWLKSSYESVRGRIVSEWTVKNGKLAMKVVIPPNVTGEVVVPGDNARISPNQAPAKSPLKGTVFHVGSGEYTFTSDLPR